jgi:hypothetical protein
LSVNHDEENERDTMILAAVEKNNNNMITLCKLFVRVMDVQPGTDFNNFHSLTLFFIKH